MANWTVKENEQGGHILEHDDGDNGIPITPDEHSGLRDAKKRAEFREALKKILKRGGDDAPAATSDDEDAIRNAVGGEPFQQPGPKVARKANPQEALSRYLAGSSTVEELLEEAKRAKGETNWDPAVLAENIIEAIEAHGNDEEKLKEVLGRLGQ